jgi:excisionase family DNA binding protein
MQHMNQLAQFHAAARRKPVQAIKDDYVTTSEAANILGINRVTLHRWVKQGTLRAYSLGPRRVLFKRSDLSELLKPMQGEGVDTDMEERLGRVIQPLTEEQAQQALAAVRAGRALGDRIARRREGKPGTPSWELINKARDERAKQLL